MYLAAEASEILMPNFITRYGSEVRPKEGCCGSLFESNREFVSELEDVLTSRDEFSKSNTTGILDDANR